jgi:hypothetical protein
MSDNREFYHIKLAERNIVDFVFPADINKNIHIIS